MLILNIPTLHTTPFLGKTDFTLGKKGGIFHSIFFILQCLEIFQIFYFLLIRYFNALYIAADCGRDVKYHFLSQESFPFFVLCLSNSCFAFWSNWITKLANTVISVTQISSTGYVSGKPVNALDSFLFPGMGLHVFKSTQGAGILVFLSKVQAAILRGESRK